MYNVLIVDDEAAHRKGVIQILNRIRPNYIILEAKDGKDADIVMNMTPVDIVLTDIRMPNKDGLSFLRDLTAGNSPAKVIIISSYGQFDYARDALSFGAYDFLLKPLDIDELEQALTKAEKSIQQQNALQQKMIHMEEVVLDSLLIKLVKNELSSEEYEQLRGIIPMQAQGLVFVLRLSQFMREELEANRINIRHNLKYTLDSSCHSLIFALNDDGMQLAGLLIPRRNYRTADIKELTKSSLKSIFPEKATIGISEYHGNLIECIKTAFQEAKDALSYTFYTEHEVCGYWEAKYNEHLVSSLLCSKERELSNAVKFGSHKDIQGVLEDIFAHIMVLDKPNPNRLIESFILLCIRLMYMLYKKYEMNDYQKLIAQFTKEMLSAFKLTDLKNSVTELCCLLNDIWTHDSDGADIITKSIRFIENNYQSDINLDEVAKLFYFTPSYYSVAFKKRIGMNFSSYLTGLRIDAACRLLTHTNDKISEVCLKSGYNDPAYFGKVFKKSIGCSPEEYRKRSLRI